MTELKKGLAAKTIQGCSCSTHDRADHDSFFDSSLSYISNIQKVAMKNFFLAIFVATIVCLPILGMNYPLEEGNNFMGAMLSVQ